MHLRGYFVSNPIRGDGEPREPAAARTTNVSALDLVRQIGDMNAGRYLESLEEATPTDFLRWLRKQKAETIAAVGHEPSISLNLSWFLTGTERRIHSFRKGGACLLEFPGEVGAGTAILLWALTPTQLRDLAD